MDSWSLIYLLFIHWVADFVLQDYKTAKQKSNNNFVLAYHCYFYGLIFAIFTNDLIFGVLLALIHFPVDYITSRINKKFYEKGDIHNFFVGIGFDQFIHIATIVYLGEIL